MVLTSKGSVGDNIVVLGRVEDKTDVHDSRVGNATNPGLNVDLRYGSANSTHRNLIRIGASGALTNGKIALMLTKLVLLSLIRSTVLTAMFKKMRWLHLQVMVLRMRAAYI